MGIVLMDLVFRIGDEANYTDYIALKVSREIQ